MVDFSSFLTTKNNGRRANAGNRITPPSLSLFLCALAPLRLCVKIFLRGFSEESIRVSSVAERFPAHLRVDYLLRVASLLTRVLSCVSAERPG